MNKNFEHVRMLLIDNYDSFTYNLVQYLGELGAQLRVVRNDEIDVADPSLPAHPGTVLLVPGLDAPALKHRHRPLIGRDQLTDVAAYVYV